MCANERQQLDHPSRRPLLSKWVRILVILTLVFLALYYEFNFVLKPRIQDMFAPSPHLIQIDGGQHSGH